MSGGFFGGKNKFNKPEQKVTNETKDGEQLKTPEQPKVETAVLLVMYEGGGKTSAITKITGIETKREATIADVYRMVSEMKSVVEVNWTMDGLIQILTPRAPVKPEDKKTEIETPK